MTTQNDDRISTDLKIKILESHLAELKSESKTSRGSKGSAFKPPHAKKTVPSGGSKGGGGGHVSVKAGKKAKASPKTPAPAPVATQQRELSSIGKSADASRKFLPAGGGRKAAMKKRKAG